MKKEPRIKVKFQSRKVCRKLKKLIKFYDRQIKQVQKFKQIDEELFTFVETTLKKSKNKLEMILKWSTMSTLSGEKVDLETLSYTDQILDGLNLWEDDFC